MLLGLLLAFAGGNTVGLIEQKYSAARSYNNNTICYYSSHGSSEIELQNQHVAPSHSFNHRHQGPAGFVPCTTSFETGTEKQVIAIITDGNPGPSKRYLADLYPSHNFW
jgi:hypothetical protein